jgi:hypothetical protein
VFESKYGEFSDDRIDKLGRREDLGQLHFDEVMPKVRQIRELMELIDRNADWADPDTPSAGGQAVDQTITAMQSIEHFDPMNPGSRDSIVRQIDNSLATLKRFGVPLFGRDIARELATRIGELDRRSTDLSDLVTDAQAKHQVIDALYRQAQAQGPAIASDRLAGRYAAQVGKYRLFGRLIAAGIVVIAAGIVVAALDPLHWFAALPTTDSLVQLASAAGPRILVLGLLLYGLRVVVRQYSINRHLEVVNTHRVNALDTFNLFGKAVPEDDQAARTVILTELVRAVFREPPTGYVDEDEGAKVDLPFSWSLGRDK